MQDFVFDLGIGHNLAGEVKFKILWNDILPPCLTLARKRYDPLRCRDC